MFDPRRTAQDGEGVIALGDAARGTRGVIVEVGCRPRNLAPDEPKCAFDIELERCLLEMGFVEGAAVEILHEGFLGKDPIAVRVDDMCVALRRREAQAVLIRAGGSGATAS
jgi:ferrous iron transport protein A